MSSKTITCMKCGAQNSTGTVFCTGCGALLSALEGRRQRVHRAHVRTVVQAVVIVIVLLVLGVGGLALWSRAEPIGECGGVEHGRQTVMLLSSLHKMAGESSVVGRDVREIDINAYVKHVRLEKLPFEAFSIDLMPDGAKVRTVRKLASWTWGGYCLAPMVSRDYTLRIKGSTVYVEEASLGHLPLPDVFKRKSYAWLINHLKDTPELELLSEVNTVVLHEDRVHLAVGENE